MNPRALRRIAARRTLLHHCLNLSVCCTAVALLGNVHPVMLNSAAEATVTRGNGNTARSAPEASEPLQIDNSSKKKVVAVVYATKGGMGDVGKFAVARAIKALSTSDDGKTQSSSLPEIAIRAIAMSDEKTEGKELGGEVDVTDEGLQAEVKDVFDRLAMSGESSSDKKEAACVIKVDAGDSRKQLVEALQGVDAVVACVGNRQPSMARWCSVGAESIISAMQANKVARLVILSSMGIGEDFAPLRNSRFAIRLLWNTMLRTMLRGAWKDLNLMEQRVSGSNLDYLIVRPVGLTPEEPPVGRWDLLDSPKDGLWGGGPGLSISVAKADVAEFMLGEAVKPTLHRRGVSIGHKPT